MSLLSSPAFPEEVDKDLAAEFPEHEHSSQWHIDQGQRGESPAGQLMRSEGLQGQQGSCDLLRSLVEERGSVRDYPDGLY